MRKCKGIAKLLSFFASFVFVLLLASPQVNAAYDDELNTVLTGDNQLVIDPTSGKLKITIQYQYQVKDIQVFICRPDADKVNCMTTSNISTFKDNQPGTSNPTGMRIHDVNNTDQETLIITFEPEAPVSGTPIKSLANGDYKVLVRASFCQVRNAAKTACASDGSWSYEEINDVKYGTNIYFQSISIKGAYTSNSKVNSVIARVLEIVNDYVIPVLWILLGVLLITRGVILAIGIVKASDEAEVRQNKIRGLTWLIIGVLAGYAITIAASWVMSILGYGGIFS